MKFMLIDDDIAVRSMLQDIIEDYDLGEVVSSLASANPLSQDTSMTAGIDIIIIDMLMPDCDGIQVIHKIRPAFTGKIIMLSQIETKELVGRVYENGADYYITKPINRNEILGVIRTISEHIRLENFVHNLQNNLASALNPQVNKPKNTTSNYLATGQRILNDLGIGTCNGSQEFTAMLKYLEREKLSQLPPLKDIFATLAKEKNSPDIKKESKAIEQRFRRTIFQSMVNIASIGIDDFGNPKFDEYASRYFDLAEIRTIMQKIKRTEKPQIADCHINTKRFIYALINDCQK